MLRNITKKTIISKNYTYKNGLKKTKGLLFRSKPTTIVFNTRFGIHTFLMNFPIDIMVLDRNNRVIYIKKGLKPNKIAIWNPLHSLVIEMPIDTIQNSRTEIGDKIEL